MDIPLDESSSLFQKPPEQAELLSCIQDVARLSLESDEAHFNRAVAQTLGRLLRASASFFLLTNRTDTGTQFLSLVAAEGDVPENLVDDFRIDVLEGKENSASALAIVEKHPVVITDIQDVSAETRIACLDEAEEHGWRSFLSVPLLGQGREPLGALSMARKKASDITPSDVQMAEALAQQVSIALQHRRREETLQRITAVGNDLIDAATETAQLDDPECNPRSVFWLALHRIAEGHFLPLLDELCSEARRLLNGKGAKVYVRVIGEEKLTLVARKNLALPLGLKIGFGEGMAGRVIISKEPMIVPDYSSWDGAVEGFKNLFTNVIEVPLVLEGNAIGVLSVFDDKEVREFVEEDIPILSRFANQAVQAIYVSTLLTQNHDRMALLSALNTTSFHINEQLNPKVLMERIVNLAAKLIGGPTRRGIGAAYWSHHPRTHQAIVRWSTSRDFLNVVISSKKGLIGRVIRTGKGQFQNNYDEWANRAPELDSYDASLRFNNVLEVPIKRNDEVIGILAVTGSKGQRPFNEADVELLASYADTVSIAVENARLFEDAQGRIEDLESIGQISREVGSKLTLQEIFDIVATRLTDRDRGLGFRDCALIGLGHSEEQDFSTPSSLLRSSKADSLQKMARQALADERSNVRIIPRFDDKGDCIVLVVPARSGNRAVAALCVESGPESPLSPARRKLVETMGNQVGSAIERASALVLLEEISKKIVSADQKEDTLRQVRKGPSA